ncbi:MAG: hypothetical protein JWR18_4255 [Segetibacter sp.]|jgi:hypothetical protein|nr:hypothetical protein [Segetibacter sp.]
MNAPKQSAPAIIERVNASLFLVIFFHLVRKLVEVFVVRRLRNFTRRLVASDMLPAAFICATKISPFYKLPLVAAN